MVLIARGGSGRSPDLDHAAELMRYAYENRDVCIETGRRAKKEILQLFHPKSWVNKYENAYRDSQPWKV